MNTLLSKAIEAAKDAGNAVMELYGDNAFETKIDGSPVTVADQRAHDIIIEHLSTTRIDILSEESEGISLPYPEQLWIIDPIDGTRGFIEKNGEFAIMIGLLTEGYPSLGVVYAPTEGRMYYAIRGEGAYLEHNGVYTRLQSPSVTSSPIRFASSRNHFTPIMNKVSTQLGAIQRPTGSIGLKAVSIAQNDADFFFTGGSLGEWDVCAPLVIAEEAGGKVTDLYGDLITFGSHDHLIERGTIFAHKNSHELVLATIQKNTE